MRTSLAGLILAILRISSCACTKDRNPVAHEVHGGSGVSINIISATIDKNGFYKVVLEFRRGAEGYNALVQELELGKGEALVEAFKGPGAIYDTHQGYASRIMHLYPAEVRGADWSPNGFAHLPANQAGTVTTNIGLSFNSEHQKNYKTQGYIAKQAPELGACWRITILEDKSLDVWVPGCQRTIGRP